MRPLFGPPRAEHLDDGATVPAELRDVACQTWRDAAEFPQVGLAPAVAAGVPAPSSLPQMIVVAEMMSVEPAYSIFSTMPVVI